jgi:hypothetical protein
LKAFPSGLSDELEPVFREPITDNHGRVSPPYAPWILERIGNQRDDSDVELIHAVFTCGAFDLKLILDPRDFQGVIGEKLDPGLNNSTLSDLAFAISIYVQETLGTWPLDERQSTNEVHVRPYPSYPPSP